jgi:hypothetical protein
MDSPPQAVRARTKGQPAKHQNRRNRCPFPVRFMVFPLNYLFYVSCWWYNKKWQRNTRDQADLFCYMPQRLHPLGFLFIWGQSFQFLHIQENWKAGS